MFFGIDMAGSIKLNDSTKSLDISLSKKPSASELVYYLKNILKQSYNTSNPNDKLKDSDDILSYTNFTRLSKVLTDYIITHPHDYSSVISPSYKTQSNTYDTFLNYTNEGDDKKFYKDLGNNPDYQHIFCAFYHILCLNNRHKKTIIDSKSNITGVPMGKFVQCLRRICENNEQFLGTNYSRIAPILKQIHSIPSFKNLLDSNPYYKKDYKELKKLVKEFMEKNLTGGNRSNYAENEAQDKNLTNLYDKNDKNTSFRMAKTELRDIASNTLEEKALYKVGIPVATAITLASVAALILCIVTIGATSAIAITLISASTVVSGLSCITAFGLYSEQQRHHLDPKTAFIQSLKIDNQNNIYYNPHAAQNSEEGTKEVLSTVNTKNQDLVKIINLDNTKIGQSVY
jgi:hypothetical protein